MRPLSRLQGSPDMTARALVRPLIRAAFGEGGPSGAIENVVGWYRADPVDFELNGSSVAVWRDRAAQGHLWTHDAAAECSPLARE